MIVLKPNAFDVFVQVHSTQPDATSLPIARTSAYFIIVLNERKGRTQHYQKELNQKTDFFSLLLFSFCFRWNRKSVFLTKFVEKNKIQYFSHNKIFSTFKSNIFSFFFLFSI